jgi:transposase
VRTPESEPIPPNTLAELRRDMERRRLVAEQIRQIEKACLECLKQAPNAGPNLMVCLLARVVGIGIETADMLVQELLSRNLRDRRAVARYAGLTGSPDESGSRCREKGLARSGNARVRRGMIQLAWRFLQFQKDSAERSSKRYLDGLLVRSVTPGANKLQLSTHQLVDKALQLLLWKAPHVKPSLAE